MKKFTLLSLLVILFGFSNNTYATKYKFVASDNRIETKICMAAVTDDTEVLRAKLLFLSRRGTALSFRSFVNRVECNDQYIGNFALAYKAQNTFAYLDNYTNSKNKKRQPNVTITEFANQQKINEENNIIVLVGGN